MIDIFLVIVALIWLTAATIQDFRKREIANWLNFSLIAVALSYRAFYSVLFWNIWPFVFGLFGLAIFFAISEALYYSRGFGGGDAKLLLALGAVLPFASSFLINTFILFGFIFLLLLAGSVYGVAYSLILIASSKREFMPEFKKQIRKKKKIFIYSGIVFIVSLVLAFILKGIFFLFSSIILLYPLLYIYAKTIEENYFIFEISSREVSIGDWLYEEIRVGNKKIKPYWEGLSEKEVEMIRKSRIKVKVRQGIPFALSFLIAFVLLVLVEIRFWGLI